MTASWHLNNTEQSHMGLLNEDTLLYDFGSLPSNLESIKESQIMNSGDNSLSKLQVNCLPHKS